MIRGGFLWLYFILFVCLCNQILYCKVEFEIVILNDHSNTVFLWFKCFGSIFSQAFKKSTVRNIIHTGICKTISQHMTLCTE